MGGYSDKIKKQPNYKKESFLVKLQVYYFYVKPI